MMSVNVVRLIVPVLSFASKFKTNLRRVRYILKVNLGIVEYLERVGHYPKA